TLTILSPTQQERDSANVTQLFNHIPGAAELSAKHPVVVGVQWRRQKEIAGCSCATAKLTTRWGIARHAASPCVRQRRHRNWAPTFCPQAPLRSAGIPGDLLPCILLRTQQQTRAPQVHTTRRQQKVSDVS